MTGPQKFCTECGAALVPGSRFCGSCGYPVTGPIAPPMNQPSGQQVSPQATPTRDPAEQIIGIVPFIEQGMLSVIHYTLIVTDSRMIFCTWNPDNDEAMSDADDDVMQESCSISETKDEIAHFQAKDWADGPWQRYRSMPLDTIYAGAPGSITLPLIGIASATIVCETLNSTQDKLFIELNDQSHEFDLMYSQGRFLFSLLKPLLGERITMEDHLHRRSKLDRILTGQEFKT